MSTEQGRPRGGRPCLENEVAEGPGGGAGEGGGVGAPAQGVPEGEERVVAIRQSLEVEEGGLKGVTEEQPQDALLHLPIAPPPSLPVRLRRQGKGGQTRRASWWTSVNGGGCGVGMA